jgi:alkyl hydroperoxide reductase subunit AhpC
MRQYDNQSMVWVNKAIPSIPVKTHFGNTFLNKLFTNQWLLIYSNPFDLIPKNAGEKRHLEDFLASLRKMNCQMVGFSNRTFEEHLECTNWINSYLSDEDLFPVFFHSENLMASLEKETVEQGGKEALNPIYLVDGSGIAKIRFDSRSKGSDHFGKLLCKVGELVLNGQLSHKNAFQS